MGYSFSNNSPPHYYCPPYWYFGTDNAVQIKRSKPFCRQNHTYRVGLKLQQDSKEAPLENYIYVTAIGFLNFFFTQAASDRKPKLHIDPLYWKEM